VSLPGRKWWAVAVLVGGAAVVTLWLLEAGTLRQGHGPLALPDRGEVSIGAPIAINTPYSYSGPLVLVNRSQRPLVLDGAQLINSGSGIALVGAFGLAVPTRATCQGLRGRAFWRCQHATKIGFVKGYRIPWDGRVLKGLKIAPHAQIQIVLGVKVVTPGRHIFNAVALRYHDGHGSYRDSYPYSARLCSPPKKYLKSCPGLLT
jgi:hypothetical protein